VPGSHLPELDGSEQVGPAAARVQVGGGRGPGFGSLLHQLLNSRVVLTGHPGQALHEKAQLLIFPDLKPTGLFGSGKQISYLGGRG
jgi:hypothetical protein